MISKEKRLIKKYQFLYLKYKCIANINHSEAALSSWGEVNERNQGDEAFDQALKRFRLMSDEIKKYKHYPIILEWLNKLNKKYKYE